MAPLTKRSFLLTLVVAALRKVSGFEGDESSCLSAKTAEDCRSEVEESTGDPCVWCTCRAVPSECLGASLAKV